MMPKTLSEQPHIDPTASVSNCLFGRYTEVGPRTKLVEVELGDYSYVVNDGDIAYATIGKFCSIAAMTRINPGNHPMQRTSQSHFTYRSSMYFADEADDESLFAWRRSHHVTIGHDSWIGHGAIVLPGRHVGIGAVVAAGAIVTKNVPDYTIVAGNPALPLRKRFSDEVIERLIRLAWWDWSHDQLRIALSDFRTLSAIEFIEAYEARP